MSDSSAPALLAVDVVFVPTDLTPACVARRSVVVFDVLRASTSITAALAAGVREVRVFPDIASAQLAVAAHRGPRLLCGEVRCLPPPGFDLGNSPCAFNSDSHAGLTAFLSTTNGTKALYAARAAPALLVGSIVNASAVARELVRIGRDVTLLCAGTNNQFALEDTLGAGAVLDALVSTTAAVPATDTARAALLIFRASRASLPQVMSQATGGRNLIDVGLEADIEFCARLDSLDTVGIVQDHPLRVLASVK